MSMEYDAYRRSRSAPSVSAPERVLEDARGAGIRRRLICRLQRFLSYWGVLSHPYGREYVTEKYTAMGGRPRRK